MVKIQNAFKIDCNFKAPPVEKGTPGKSIRSVIKNRSSRIDPYEILIEVTKL